MGERVSFAEEAKKREAPPEPTKEEIKKGVSKN